MSLNFGDVELEGPFSKLDELKDESGLFVILCYKFPNFELLDIRISKSVQSDVAGAFTNSSWAEVCTGKLRIACFYSSDQDEMEITKQKVLEAEL